MTVNLTTTAIDADADRALKAKHRTVWASGDYPELAGDLIWSLGPTLVEAAGILPGSRSSTSRPGPATSPSRRP